MSFPGILVIALTAILLLPQTPNAQDQCNLLPEVRQSFPLYSLIPHTLTPTNLTLCEKYTPAGSTQLDWIISVVNLAFTGNYVPLPDLWPADPNGTYQTTGILDPNAVYRDPCLTVTPINLVKYFNGTWKSTNRGGMAVAINFLDGGSEPALRSNVPAWDQTSNQHRLFTSLYAFFGLLFGCNSPSFPLYTGPSSQTAIHRFMDLRAPEIHYFIHCIYDAAVDHGVAGPDLVTHVGDAISIGIALDNVFNKRCSPPQVVGGVGNDYLQDICSDPTSCAHWSFPDIDCAAYSDLKDFGVMPELAGWRHCNIDGKDHKHRKHPHANS